MSTVAGHAEHLAQLADLEVTLEVLVFLLILLVVALLIWRLFATWPSTASRSELALAPRVLIEGERKPSCGTIAGEDVTTSGRSRRSVALFGDSIGGGTSTKEQVTKISKEQTPRVAGSGEATVDAKAPAGAAVDATKVLLRTPHAAPRGFAQAAESAAPTGSAEAASSAAPTRLTAHGFAEAAAFAESAAPTWFAEAAGSVAAAGFSMPANSTGDRRSGFSNIRFMKHGSPSICSVFSADCALDGKRIVCKQLSLFGGVNQELLSKELKILRRFQGDDEVVQILGYNDGVREQGKNKPQQLYLEYLHGKDLGEVMSDWKKAGDKSSIPEVLSLAKGIAQGMAKVHKRGVAHRDLKPDNIMRLEGGRIKMIDFGSAALAEDEKEMKRVVGTPNFMALELCRTCSKNESSSDGNTGAVHDQKVDVYSYASVLWALLTLRVPYQELGEDGEAIVETALAGGRASLTTDPTRAQGTVLQTPTCAKGTILETVMEMCWSENPRDRPSFPQILDILSKPEHARQKFIKQQSSGTLTRHNSMPTPKPTPILRRTTGRIARSA